MLTEREKEEEGLEEEEEDGEEEGVGEEWASLQDRLNWRCLWEIRNPRAADRGVWRGLGLRCLPESPQEAGDSLSWGSPPARGQLQMCIFWKI